MSKEYHFYCDNCKQYKVYYSDFTTGYGKMPDGKKYCFDCCGKWDQENMLKTGYAILYLSYDQKPGKYLHTGFMCPQNGKLSNWPGTLVIPISTIKIGRHNKAGRRFDVWFTYMGAEWHGVQYGDNTQICHCKRLKLLKN